MKFEIKQKMLITYLNLLTPIVDKTILTNPASSNIKIVVENNLIKLETLNLTSSLEASIKVDENIVVEEVGEITVSASKLSSMVKNLNEDISIKFEMEENWINIFADKSKFKLFTLPVEEFPSYEIAENPIDIEVDKEKFYEILNLTSFAIANIKKEIREFMKGMLLEFEDSKINAVATDGHRLAFAKTDINAKHNFGSNNKFILPEKSVQNILKLLAIVEDEKINLKIAKNQIQMNTEEFSFKSKLIMADYAAYRDIIPKNEDIKAIINIDNLKKSLFKVKFLADEYKSIVNFFIEGKTMFLKVENKENEKAEDDFEIEFEGMEKYEISFNYNYLMDVLNKAKDDEKNIEVYFNKDKEKSALLKIEKNNDFFYIVMPTKN